MALDHSRVGRDDGLVGERIAALSEGAMGLQKRRRFQVLDDRLGEIGRRRVKAAEASAATARSSASLG